MSHLPEHQRKELQALILEFRDRFDGSLGKTSLGSHSTKLKQDASPIILQPYRMSPHERGIESEYIRKLLDQGAIKPSNSPWGFPNALAPKKKPTGGDAHRATTNFMRLSELTVKDAYPLPRIADALDSLGGSRYFSALDSNSGFFQIPLAEEGQEKATMIFYEGLFSYARMPMGLMNSPATFQRLMDRIFADVKWKFAIDYLGDLIVYSSSFKEHLKRLREALSRFRKAGITLRLSKCSFARSSIKYLGYIASSAGYEPGSSKVAAIQDIKPPQSIKEVRSFLGMLGCFRAFIKNFAGLARPLADFARKNAPSAAFGWREAQQEAFEALKSRLMNAPILCFPNYKERFYLEADASNIQIGAALMQKCSSQIRAIGYYSRRLNRAEEKYPTTEKECLAVAWAITECCRPYLYGAPFTAITDHEPLRSLLNLKDPNGRLARWALKLATYDFKIVTRPGRVHSAPDALSRLPCEGSASQDHADPPDRCASIKLARMEPSGGRSGYSLLIEKNLSGNILMMLSAKKHWNISTKSASQKRLRL